MEEGSDVLGSEFVWSGIYTQNGPKYVRISVFGLFSLYHDKT